MIRWVEKWNVKTKRGNATSPALYPLLGGNDSVDCAQKVNERIKTPPQRIDSMIRVASESCACSPLDTIVALGDERFATASMRVSDV